MNIFVFHLVNHFFTVSKLPIDNIMEKSQTCMYHSVNVQLISIFKFIGKVSQRLCFYPPVLLGSKKRFENNTLCHVNLV